ncbi:uncharacterized protein PRCAT00005435001 [Priceomyces carsonii]|uniref:uncharacterized protein n=1 Tax=Priceomyces carsonii TaxID=28549 RepID=UPI002ED8F203|nr:unnamed protein product [Priceomyces carsonii]
MLRVGIKRILGSPKGYFFNSNVSILHKVNREVSSSPLPRVDKRSFTNIQILKSSFGPDFFNKCRTTFVNKKYIIQQSRSFRRNNVWSNYNSFYGRSNWNKLKGPALFAVLFCVGTSVAVPYVVNNTPLRRNPMVLVYSLIAINGAVFLMWRVPQFSRVLTRYGLLVKNDVYSNWSLLTAAFSHQSFAHLFVNMFVLQSFGTTLCAVVGASNFLIMYLNSAVIASFFSMAIPTLLRSSMSVASLGASGAIFSVVGTFSYLFPKAPVALFFIPIPGGAWILFLGTVVYNLAGTFLRWGRYDYAAHIGGSIAGIAYGWWFKKKRDENLKKRRLAYF